MRVVSKGTIYDAAGPHPAGEAVELDDAEAADLIGRGLVTAADAPATAASAPAPAVTIASEGAVQITREG